MSDLISRDEALTALRDTLKSGGKSKGLRPVTFEMIWAIKSLPSAEQGWISVTERLPEEDKEVLITYKGKGDELEKPYSNIDITTYGQMYFGGNKVGNYKHWRSPFQYFNDNYEVTAWMPLPDPYEGLNERSE